MPSKDRLVPDSVTETVRRLPESAKETVDRYVPESATEAAGRAVPDSTTGLVTRVLPDRIRRSYVAKFGLVIAIVLVVTLGVAGVSYLDLSDRMTADTQNQMQLTAELEADELGAWIESHEQRIQAAATDEETGTQYEFDESSAGTMNQIRTDLNGELGDMPDEVRAIHYVDLESDTVVQSTDPESVDMDVAALDLELHRGDGSSEAAYEDVLLHMLDSTHSDTFEYNGEPVVAFFSPVGDSDDRALMTIVSVEAVADNFRNHIAGSHTEIADATSGDVMIATNTDAIHTEYRADTGTQFLRDDGDEAGAMEFDDTDEVVAYSSVPNTDWVLVTHVPQSSAYTLISDMARSLGAIIAIALIGFLFIGATIGRSTAHALDGLASNAVALSRGDTDIETADDGRIDEVGDVRDSFASIRQYLETAADQADAIARQEFDDPALEDDVPGQLGDSLATMRTDLETYIADIEASKADAEASKEEAAQARREAEELADRLERKATEFGAVMSEAAGGDFTQRLDEDVDNEALAEIATAFNGMLEDLEGTIVDIQTLAEDVDQVSGEVTGQVGEIETASNDVSRSAEEIATATAEQSDRFQEAYGEMNDLSATVEEIASTAADVANVSETAAERADAAGEATGEIRTEMDRLEDRAESITEQVEQLDDEMGEIRDIVDLIDDIAEQTNLLALNASIEAAGAGEEGDGFAVVANEVKSLAEETGEATREVDERISNVEASVDETVAEIERMRERVDEGVEVVDDGIEAIDAITEQVDEANAGVQSINDATDEQARASERVVTMVDEATEISEETKEETQTVAAAAEEQAATVADVAAGANSLTEMADTLRTSLEAFAVSDDIDRTGGESDVRSSDLTDAVANRTAPGSANDD